MRIPRSRRSFGKVLTKPAGAAGDRHRLPPHRRVRRGRGRRRRDLRPRRPRGRDRARALLGRQPRRRPHRSATSRSVRGRWRGASRSSPVGLALTMISLERLVARRHARPRRHRHRAGPRGAVRDDLGERQVQRHRRGVRLGRHRSAHRRRGRLGDRRLPHRRRRPAGRVRRPPPASPSVGLARRGRRSCAASPTCAAATRARSPTPSRCTVRPADPAFRRKPHDGFRSPGDNRGPACPSSQAGDSIPANARLPRAQGRRFWTTMRTRCRLQPRPDPGRHGFDQEGYRQSRESPRSSCRSSAF